MDQDDRLVAISALQHYLYCPRQCALIHVEQLWAENRLTAEGRLQHERVDKPQAERRRGVRTVTGMPLTHRSLAISGTADVVEFHAQATGERAFPVEHKRGKPKGHRADEVQLCAQALCLEDMLGQPIDAGALFYGETRRRLEVPFDAELRELTVRTIGATRALLQARITPRAVYMARRCNACSLIDLCQPKLLNRPTSVETWLLRQLES